VIVRLFQQWRVEQWGKWRPSAEAKRLGDKAITIERYLTRDGYSLDEVVSILTTPTGSAYTRKEIEAIYLRLPVRQGRPVMVSDDSFATTIPANDNPADPVEQQEREAAMRFAVAELDRLVESMEDEDRLILQMRFWQGLKVPDIADRLHLQPKKVYKRIDRLLRDLRSKLEAAGVHSDVVNHLLGKGD
jgi:RNA polymerase sigma factor for flagellar operon FliA